VGALPPWVPGRPSWGRSCGRQEPGWPLLPAEGQGRHQLHVPRVRLRFHAPVRHPRARPPRRAADRPLPSGPDFHCSTTPIGTPTSRPPPTPPPNSSSSTATW